MKTIQTLLVATAFIFASCGSSISSDAQEVADLQCKVKKLRQQAMSGDASSAQDAQEFMTEAAALLQELNSKYSTIQEKQEFQSALANATAKCN